MEEVSVLDPLSHEVIGCAIEVHKELGPGLMESVYQKCLYRLLSQKGYNVEMEVSVPVYFQGECIDPNGFRLDLLVNKELIIELKAVEELQKVHFKQLYTYLKLSNRKLGLLINFNEQLLKNGIHRVIN